MQYTAFIVLFLTLIAKICFASLSIKTSDVDESLVKTSIDILESCYTDRFGTVGIAGPSAGSIIKRMSLRKTVISATLIEETTTSVSHNSSNRASRYKLQLFVVTATDPKHLVKTLGQVKNSTWWNHMASFFLIDSTEGKNVCSNAYKLLWEAWKMNLINSKFICHHQTRGSLIYTFNPYTGKAPSPWQQENMVKGINDHIWTLFVREYTKNESPCDGLDFDKTVDLGGHEIRAVGTGMENWWSADPNKKPFIHFRVENVSAQLLMDSLNAKWKILSSEKLDMISSGRKDIYLGIAGLTFNVPFRSTYPFLNVELAVVTQYQGHKSQLEKLSSVLDRRSRFGVLVVLMITLLFFKCWLRKPLIPAILNLFLLVCNAGLQIIPKKTAPRIYLASLFIFVVTIQGIYSGQLASLLTKKVRLPAVNSLEDLARSDHTIYAEIGWLPYFDQSMFKGRLIQIPSEDCIKYIRSDAKAACADGKLALISPAARNNLHLSRASMGDVYAGYFIRDDWPLEERVNTVYGRLAASGILNLLYAREVQSEMNSLESYELEDREPERKVLSLAHLGFAFTILGIGLGCATMVFIVEVATKGWE